MVDHAAASNLTLVRRLVRESFRKHALGYAVAIAAMAVGAGMTAATAWLMKRVTDEFVGGESVDSALLAGMVAGVFMLKGAATYLYSVTLNRVGNSIVAERQMTTYERVLHQGLAFYDAHSSADLITRVTQGAQAARAVLDTLVTSFARDALTLLALLAVMVAQQPALTLAVLVIGPLVILLIGAILRRVRRIMAMEYHSIAQIIGVMQETVIGARVVKSFHLERLMLGRMRKAVTDVQTRANALASLEAVTHPLMETLAGLVIASMILASGVLVTRGGETLGEITAFITALLLSYEPAKRLARTRVSLEAGMVGVRMMFDIADRQLLTPEQGDALPLRVERGRIDLERVTFAYVHEPVVRDLSLGFAPGRVTALVGTSGSGKSTVFNLIMRLHDPHSGRVLIDGQDIRGVTLRSLRQAIGYVGQDTFLFSGTVMSNLLVAREGATREEAVEAAVAANAHDFITRMPMGYETDIGENGARLSGGERQRLSVARVLLKDAPIMLFDEATSALDPLSEAIFRETIGRFSGSRTVLVIAHRLSTARQADEIAVLEAGSIVEFGTHDALMQLNGAYQRLYDGQLL